ncbi:MFS transporter [Tissierella sp.]|uniref:MFS transporter n=1 Tax=Tissierella sp. TaxID=41274 RepID=UPI00286096BA|nr:MFS transporter [Tissierella sp.]MDR7855528.1 MFS transporter [Tissierella sp.]
MKKNNVSGQGYQGNDKLLIGLLLALITFGMFAQTILNIATTIRTDLGIGVDASNMAISLAALFSGIFIVVLGGLGDRFGRIKITKIGLVLSVIGSFLIAVSPKGTATFLLTGRAIQGLSSACIMPNALALIKAYYEGPARQRAVSVYSIGSWGGSALSSLFGGIIASTIGWRWIYWFSIAIAIASFFLIAGVPESKNPPSKKKAGFDSAGVITFMIGMLSINIMISQGGKIGWLSPMTLGLGLLSAITFFVFYKIEKNRENSFIDFDMFSNKTYKGATISNFLLNGAAGTLIVTLSLVQLAAGLTSLQAGFLTIGYLIAILIAIKVGEKLLQKLGARKPMVLGCAITGFGIFMTTFTHLMTDQYMLVATIGFTFFGMGLGLYATPSADAALSSVPADKAGSASGIYRMASALGAAFGIAISAAIFTGLGIEQVTFVEGFFRGRTDNISIRYAAIIALLFNLFMTMSAIISILLTVPPGKPETKDGSI